VFKQIAAAKFDGANRIKWLPTDGVNKELYKIGIDILGEFDLHFFF
jgi:hypothetical protein